MIQAEIYIDKILKDYYPFYIETLIIKKDGLISKIGIILIFVWDCSYSDSFVHINDFCIRS